MGCRKEHSKLIQKFPASQRILLPWLRTTISVKTLVKTSISQCRARQKARIALLCQSDVKTMRAALHFIHPFLNPLASHENRCHLQLFALHDKNNRTKEVCSTVHAI